MDKPTYKTFIATVTTLSPLHIGTGRELMQDFDYAVRNRKTWRLDENALLDAQRAEDPAVMKQLMSVPPAQLLSDGDFKTAKYFRYVVNGEPASKKLREYIKTPQNMPYLPGSSLKGALRTAILWFAWQDKGLVPDLDEITTDQRRDGSRILRKREFAAESFEREIAGRKPADSEGSDANYDLMRALLVGDSEPISSESLEVVRTAVFRTNGKIDKFTDVEAVAKENVFTHSIKIDTALFSEWATRHGLKLANGDPRAGGWLENLVEISRKHTEARVQFEQEYFRKANQKLVTRLNSLYEKFNRLSSQLKGQKFWLQLGWGSGWNGKTFGSNLRQSDEFMNGIIGGYNHGRRHTYAHPDLFPISRRLKVSDEEQPIDPMGWVLVELTEHPS
jgi:CRISPR-associated protein Csm5